MPDVKQIAAKVARHLKPHVRKIEIAGSIRRKVPDPTDVDILVVGNPGEVYGSMTAIGNPIKEGKMIQSYMVDGVQVDIYFAENRCFGAMLFFLTGPNSYNIAYRMIAKRQDKLLSQYGLFDRVSGKMIVCSSEKAIYKALGKEWKPPELRGF